jgi:PAS domain S-box-containing protein
LHAGRLRVVTGPAGRRQSGLSVLMNLLKNSLKEARMPTNVSAKPPVAADDARVQLLASIVDSSDDAVIGKTTEGIITSWNRAAEQIYGYPASEMIGQPISRLAAPDQAGEMQEILKRIRAGERVEHFETVRLRKDGKTIPVALTVSPINDAKGRLIGVSTIARDISQRKLADEQLRIASQYARSLIEASLDPLVTISPQGKITDVNEAAVKVTGVSKEQLVGTDFSDYFTEPDKAREGYRQVFALGAVTDYPLTIRHRSGELTDVLYNASVYRDAQGNVLGVFAAARDVTEQKQAAQYSRSLIEASLDPLVTISPEGKITDVNQATIEVTGMARQQLVGTDFSDYFTEPDKAREGYQQVFAKGFVTNYPLTIRHREGRQTDVLYNASVYKDTQGRVMGVFAAARDVTVQKQASEYARSLIEASLDPLVTISPEGKITDVNEATIKVTGMPREQLVGTDFSDYFTEPEKAREGYRQVFALGAVTDYPLTIRHKSGQLTDVLYNASVYRDIQGNVLGVFAAARDVMAQKQAAQYARSLIEASLDPLVTISPEGKITDVNEATIKVTGMQRADLVGTDFSDYFTEPEKAREGYQQVFANGFVTDYPLTIRHKSGQLTDVLYNASVYRDVQGNVLGVFAAARDVTDSRRVMREFTETKNFLDNILQSSTKYSIIGKDLNARILSWNEGARRNYGYSEDQIIGKQSGILHAPEDIQSGAVSRMLAMAYEKGLSEGEFVRVRKDGSRFVASVVVTRRNDSAGLPIGYLLMSTDITEKKQAEEKLRIASQYARSLIEASLDPLVTISPEGKITDVNQATVQVTGVPQESLIGTDFSDYFVEPEKAREGYRQVFAKGFVTDYPLTIRHRDNKLTDVLYNASVYKDEQGNVMGVFAAARDVTAQKQASQYARSLIEASLDPLVTISPEGKITDVNEATINVTGVPRETLIGADFSDYFTEPVKAREGYQQVFSKGFVTDYPLTIRHRNRGQIDVLYNASVYKDVRGNVLGVFAAARDVTAQKNAEAQVAEQRAKELERLAELERFQKLTVGRELKMIELKKEIEELRRRIPADTSGA